MPRKLMLKVCLLFLRLLNNGFVAQIGLCSGRAWTRSKLSAAVDDRRAILVRIAGRDYAAGAVEDRHQVI
jgi:hypothetical protein